MLTVGLNVVGGSKAGAFSIAASLMCMIYALGNVSGAHFNPAVTLAITLSGRDKMEGGFSSAAMYMAAQIAAYVCFSRVRKSNRVCILQPFSPFLFRQGPPKGPSRLLRLWKRECTFEEMLEEWQDDPDSDDENGGADKAKDVMKRKLSFAPVAISLETTSMSTLRKTSTSQTVQNFGLSTCRRVHGRDA